MVNHDKLLKDLDNSALPENVKVIQYADDISIYAIGPKIKPLAENITNYMISAYGLLVSWPLQYLLEQTSGHSKQSTKNHHRLPCNYQ